MNKDQDNKEQQKPEQQPQQTESIKLKQQKQQDYSKGNRTCMATGKNGIDFQILASIVQQKHSDVVNQAIQQLDYQ